MKMEVAVPDEKPHIVKRHCGLCHSNTGKMIEVSDRIEVLILLVATKILGKCDTLVIQTQQNKTTNLFCIQHLFNAGNEFLKYVEKEREGSVGTRIVEKYAQYICGEVIEPGSLREALEAFMDKYSGHRRAKYNLTGELKLAKFERYVVGPRKLHQCMMCASEMIKEEAMFLETKQDKFFFCLFLSPLISNIVTFNQTHAIFGLNRIAVCRSHKKSEVSELRRVKEHLHEPNYRKRFLWMTQKMIGQTCLLECLKVVNICTGDNLMGKKDIVEKSPMSCCDLCNVYIDGRYCFDCEKSVSKLLSDLGLNSPYPVVKFEGERLHNCVKAMKKYFILPPYYDTIQKAKIYLILIFTRYWKPASQQNKRLHNGAKVNALEHTPMCIEPNSATNDDVMIVDSSTEQGTAVNWDTESIASPRPPVDDWLADIEVPLKIHIKQEIVEPDEA